MANEFYTTFGSGGESLYLMMRTLAGLVWYPTGEAFETPGTGSRTPADYDLTVTDCSYGHYKASMDTNITVGTYIWQIMLQAGASPADGDECINSGVIEWSGSAEETIHAKLDLILADTGELQTDWANGGRLDLILDAVLADTNELQGLISDSKLPAQVEGMDADVLTASALKADAVDEIHDEIVEGTITHRQAIRLMLSILTGLSSGGGTGTVVFRDISDTKNRFSADVDEYGNRTVINTRNVT